MGAVVYTYYKNAFDGRCEKDIFKAYEFDSRQAMELKGAIDDLFVVKVAKGDEGLELCFLNGQIFVIKVEEK